METEITDPNCIVKAFQNKSISIIKDENNKYYFRGSDVAKALEITNVRSSIQNFTSKEKGVHKCPTRGGPQDIIFLSSHGVYRLLYSSKKKIAENFREWVGDILDDIIFNESNQLKKQLDEKQKVIENNTCTKKIEKHEFLIEKFKFRKCVYIAEINEKLIKIGSSKNIELRLIGLKKDYLNCTFLDIFECDNYRDVEENILKDNKIVENLYKKPIHNNKHPQEVVELSNNFTYLHILNIVKEYTKQITMLSPSEQLENKKIDFLNYLIKEKNYSLSDIEKISKITFNPY